MKPTYLVIGAAKCGTTSLCALLGSHPDVFMAEQKEVNYFSYDELYAQGPTWYEGIFKNSGASHARGEGSPLYTLGSIYPDAPRRISEYDESLKLIYIVRNPIERIEAGWLEMRSWGDEKAHSDFNTALKQNSEWLVDTSNYWQEIQRYRRYYSDDQILILFFEDFVDNWETVLRQCFKFLGVDPYIEIDESLKYLNKSADKRIRREKVSILRSIPVMGMLFSLAKMLLPEVIRSPIRDYVLNTRVRIKPSWDPASRQWVIEQLIDDTERFLKFYGKEAGFWDLRIDTQKTIN